jgi:hypothetical protein
MPKQLSKYVKKHLSSKIRKIREAVAINMLREREKKAGITRDVNRYERKG